ncbi:hypothetical protein J6590_103049 [Homalodisca vitripennis]|nr:hypothetical protein J6590_103049 [Homalodisca vitripennis]
MLRALLQFLKITLGNQDAWTIVLKIKLSEGQRPVPQLGGQKWWPRLFIDVWTTSCPSARWATMVVMTVH